MLVKVQGRDVFYRPIAGTRWRGKDEAEDQRLEREMLASEKERAEHIMLVDLGRNDLGRVCDYGTVKPEKLLTVERYSHVMHLVSSLRGRLREDVACFDALMACFPRRVRSSSSMISMARTLGAPDTLPSATQAIGASKQYTSSGNAPRNLETR